MFSLFSMLLLWYYWSVNVSLLISQKWCSHLSNQITSSLKTAKVRLQIKSNPHIHRSDLTEACYITPVFPSERSFIITQAGVDYPL